MIVMKKDCGHVHVTGVTHVMATIYDENTTKPVNISREIPRFLKAS